MINEWQREILKETLNLGVGKASAAIGTLAQCEVQLTIPEAEVTNVESLISEMQDMGSSKLSAVKQEYSGPFEGTALMIYSQDESLKLVKLLMGSDTPEEQLSELETDALCEVGNIVLNACLAAIGELLSEEIETSLPELITGSSNNVLTLGSKIKPNKEVIFLRMGFKVPTDDLTGYISFLLESDKIQVLLDKLDAFYKNIASA